MRKIGTALGALLVVCLAAGSALAEGQEKGAETNLPIPRFVSLKSSEGYVRRGPSTSHRIDWVFTRRNMPLEIIGEYGHWRQVRDKDGATGWVHYTLVSGVRTVVVDHDLTALHVTADDNAPITARAETGVIARLKECTADWCRISADGYVGWVPKTTIWGVSADEVRD